MSRSNGAERARRRTRVLVCMLSPLLLGLAPAVGADADTSPAPPSAPAFVLASPSPPVMPPPITPPATPPATPAALAALPDHGAVPAIAVARDAASLEILARQADARAYRRHIRRLRRTHFAPTDRVARAADEGRPTPGIRESTRERLLARRAEGCRHVRALVDPAAFVPLVEELGDEREDVRAAVLDHLLDQGELGQAALVWTAIHHGDEAFRGAALMRLTAPASPAASPPASPPALRVLDTALRSRRHQVVNQAGLVAGSLGALETIPLLIFSMAAVQERPDDEGDIAWIAIQTQQSFVSNLQAVVGDNAAAFQPVLGVVSEGIVLRVMDAVVIILRTDVHRALVSMTTYDWGESTAHLGYDMRAWWRWYNDTYVPYKNAQVQGT